MTRVSPNRAEPVSIARCRMLARAAWLSCALVTTAFAHEGHDHGAEPAVEQQALAPRLTHSSAKLEVVALLQGRDLLVYADDYASNRPAAGLRVDVRSGGRLTQALETEPGLYRANLQIEPQIKDVQLDLSLSGEGIAERFSGNLPVDVDADAHPAKALNTRLLAGAGIAALLLLIASVWLLRRRRSA